MRATVYLMRDKEVPGRYNLGRVVGEEQPGRREVELIPWRDARRIMEPDAYAEMCRLSFVDWCARNPELMP